MARTQRERDDEKRKAKLEEIREQVEEGSLSIRQMTDEERERYRPAPRKKPSADPPKKRKGAPRRPPS
jgi:hypothetical protein